MAKSQWRFGKTSQKTPDGPSNCRTHADCRDPRKRICSIQDISNTTYQQYKDGKDRLDRATGTAGWGKVPRDFDEKQFYDFVSKLQSHLNDNNGECEKPHDCRPDTQRPEDGFIKHRCLPEWQ